MGMDIRAHLKAAGIRQRHLAQRIGVSDAALSKMLSGKQVMTAADVVRIAEALEVDVGAVAHAAASMQPAQAS